MMTWRTCRWDCAQTAPGLVSSRGPGNWRNVVLAAAVVALVAAGCTSRLVSLQTPFMEDVGDVAMSARELRVRVVEFGRHYSATVEQAADAISVSTNDPAVQRAAVLWKARAIPAAQEAVLQIDPLMALVDIWAFSLQMEDFFGYGAGAEWFGAEQPIARATAAQLVADVRALAVRVSISGNVAAPEQEIELWVANHAIRDEHFLRDSVIGSGADLLGDQRGAFALVGDMNTTTREIGYRLAFYNEYLLKQVQWAVELGGTEFLQVPAVDSLLTNLNGTLVAAAAMSSDFDSLAARERSILMTTVGSERAILLKDLDRQRVALLTALAQERGIVLDAVTAERIAAMQSIRGEREATLASMTAMFNEAKEESRSLVDHAIDRITRILAAGLLAFALFGVVALILIRRWFAPR